MKIKQYIVTYNNNKILHNCLQSIFNNLNDYELDILDVYVINNHSNFALEEKFKDKVNVIHNYGRPDFSTGHLSRSWNQCIIHGFVDLNNPSVDIVATCQNDTIFQKNYVTNLIELHKIYDFVNFEFQFEYHFLKEYVLKYINLFFVSLLFSLSYRFILRK